MSEDITIETVLDILLNSYTAYYNIKKNVAINEIVYDAVAEYHSRGEKYILVKKAKLWAAETNEYVYIISCDILDKATLQKLISNIIDESLKIIKPHNEHMVSYISLIIITNQANNDALTEAAKKTFKKSFKFSFHGWTELRIAVIDINKKSITINPSGKEIGTNFRKTLKNFYIN